MEDSKLEFPTIKNAKCEPIESYQSSTFEQKNKIPYALVHSSLADTINVLFSYLIPPYLTLKIPKIASNEFSIF